MFIPFEHDLYIMASKSKASLQANAYYLINY